MNRSWKIKTARLIYLTGVLFLILPVSSFAMEQTATDGKWSYKASAYLWASGIGGTSSSGGNVDVSFGDIIENLDMAAMGAIEARKGKLAILADFIYMDLSASQGWTVNVPVGPLNIPTNVTAAVELKSWIINIAAGYNVKQTEATSLDVIAGLRYTSMDVDLALNLANLVTTTPARIAVTESNWDAFIGIKGNTRLSEKWDAMYRFDIGAGDSDLTLHAFAGIGYQFHWGKAVAGYRYLHYDFKANNLGVLMQDLDISGPILGAQFNF